MPKIKRARWSLVVSSLWLGAASGGGCFTESGPPLGSTGDDDTSAGAPMATAGGVDDDGTPPPGTTSSRPTTAADDDSTSDDSTSEGPAACGGGSSCRPDPGPEWSGPFAVADAARGCGGAFPDASAPLFADLSVEESSCTCACGVPDVQCSTAMSVVGYAALNCVTGQGAQPIGEDQCYNTFARSHAVTLGDASSSCADGRVTAVIPAPRFGVEVVACEGTESAGTCAQGERCVPDPDDGFSGGICYRREGDIECPPDFPDKTVYFNGLEDIRSCPEACPCTASPATCSVAVVGYASPGCENPQGSVSADSGGQVCAATDSALVESIRPETVMVEDAGSCAAAEPTSPSGEVVATGDVTVCCSG